MGYKVEVICIICKEKRIVDYRMRWLIRSGKSTGVCRKCFHKSDRPNRDGLKLGWGWNKGLIGFRKGHPPYMNKFGKDNPAWKGGITPINKKIRNSKKYANWRKQVFERDNYTCQECGQRGGKLCVDHILPFSKFINLRFDIDNGRTLCYECHKKTATFAGKSVKYVV